MGCDIHFYVEKKENNSWRACDIWQEEVHMESDGSVNQSVFVELKDRLFSNRNYDLFAILANVRNSKNPGYTAIADPRGIPENASREYKLIVEEWGEDGHSHSWFTLKELLEFNWSQTRLTPSGEKTYAEAAGSFYTWTLSELAKLDPNPENVRCLFFFDN